MVSRPRGKRRGLNRAGEGLGLGLHVAVCCFIFPLASPGATESGARFGTLVHELEHAVLTQSCNLLGNCFDHRASGISELELIEANVLLFDK